MPLVRFDEGPKIGDDVLLEIQTTDADGNPCNPYKVSTVTVYYLERGVASGAENQDVVADDITVSFSTANPVKVYGNEGNPAWLDGDPESVLTQITEDADGNPVVGLFQVVWTPEFVREGDYFVCWTWEPIIAGASLSSFIRFYLKSNTTLTTTLPTQVTKTGKYERLMDRYLPDMYKNVLSNEDLTPDVVGRLNLAVAEAFTDLEDRANQILSLQDSNALTEALLPYLSNLFSWKLRTHDANLQRRQIKRAVPLYKMKGTLRGLTEALAVSGIILENLTQYWQVVSKSTYQEAFRVENDNDSSFTLAKIPLTVDPLNFELSILPADGTDYVSLTSDDVNFTVDDGAAFMDWVGSFELNKDDILKVLYKIAPVTDQSVEDYIRSLPLMDNRSEIVMRDENICYPKKNWNVRLIALDDSMFSVICPTRHPYHDPVIFGKVRTEFPYSENIYNMDEYNGSTRDSTNPCDIDKNFIDSCPCCLSSDISLDVELQELTNDRMTECLEIIREFVPFHARLYSVNFNGAVEEFMLPPVEEVTTYMTVNGNDNVIQGQMVVNRTIQPWTENLKREMLATANNLITDHNGFGQNIANILYYPEENFDSFTMGLQFPDNLLEILSGLNAGRYTVTNPNKHVIDIVEDLPNPFNATKFPFRLSNLVYTGSGDIYQDDKFTFSDATVNFAVYNMALKKNGPSCWKIVIPSGPYAGTYEIYDIQPDGSLVIVNWPTTSSVTGLSYSLYTDGSFQELTSIAGKVSVERRGRFESADDLINHYQIKVGYYLSISNVQYKITGFMDDSKLYVSGYTAGTQVGIGTVKIYKRLVDNKIGYINVRGIVLSTTTNYYDNLQVSDQFEDDQHIDNFTILIGTDYYQISSWSNTTNGDGRYEIVLVGTPLPSWGLTPVSGISFSIVQFLKTSPVEVTKTFPVLVTHSITKVDRRGESFGTSQVSGMPANLAAAYLNAVNNGQPFEVITQGENISYTIEYKE
jgi:hypothetical protein